MRPRRGACRSPIMRNRLTKRFLAHEEHRTSSTASAATRCIASMREHSGGGLALVPTAPEVPRNRDSLFPYRPDSYFYYLSGFPEPEAVIALVSPAATAIVTSCSAARRTRSARSGTAFATAPTPRARSSASTRRIPSPSSTRSCPSSPRDRPALFTPLGLFEPLGPAHHAAAERRARARAHRRVRARRSGRRARHARRDAPRQGRARGRPDAPRRRDLAAARTGARWSARVPGWFEYQVEAELMHEFLQAGAQAVAYPSIVASGPERVRAALSRQQPRDERRRAPADRRRLRVPGLRVRHHAHVSGQRQVQRARRRTSTSSCSRRSSPASTRSSRARTSTTITRPPSACSRRATSTSACAKGTLDEVLESGSYKQFYMHRAGHWLGMDVHDAGLYQVKGASQKLVPGHGAHRRARHVHPARRTTCPRRSGTSACASRTTCW